MGYVELSSSAFCKYNGVKLMTKVMVGLSRAGVRFRGVYLYVRRS